ncbi:Pep3/Vps18/deep orange family-domain-containing protein [Dunaliella salina]|uniref:Pep3/Vps18/deep orange family-domain-containing protein n=1 Tax=Dunaliella salina TaxID=3046 RepID=A0ABQ7GJ44_DUNSA|nr:Pep3/Vps18/deep orange family-domain-containing protein [Dunaliella salina]|eukprot:KAF5834626.1 Pep3/Vps18/deep orange family-domain-containing protein [Dunaliella salina]
MSGCEVLGGRGHLVCVAACNDVVVVATSRGYVLRYQWDDYGNEKVTEVEVVRGGTGGGSGGFAGNDTCVTALYMDPTASHVIITARVQGMAETHYLHHRWSKAKPLVKLRGTNVMCVAWPPPAPAAVQPQQQAKPRSVQGRGSSKKEEDEGGEPAPWLSYECTGPVLLGTDSGLVHEIIVDAEKWAAKKEPLAPRQVLDLRDARKEVHAIEQGISLPGDAGRLVLLSTSHALYALRAASPGVPLEALPEDLHPSKPNITTQTDPPAQMLFPIPPVLEAPASSSLPSPQQRSGAPHPHFNQLLLLHAHPGSHEPTRLAWRVGPLVYHGELSHAVTSSTPKQPPTTASAPDSSFAAAAAFEGHTSSGAAGHSSSGAQGKAHHPKPQPGEGILRAMEVLPLVAEAADAELLEGEGEGEEELRSMVMTQFHFVVLIADRLRAINRVSGRCVAEVGFRTPLLSARTVSGLPGSRAVDGLVMDPITRTMYMYSDESLYEVVMRAEARDMWRVYLEKQEWDTALQMCHSPAQRDEVHNTTAETMFCSGNFDEAARHWAKLSGANPPFEEIALRLVSAEAPRAIRVYLATKLALLKANTARASDRAGNEPAASQLGMGNSQGLASASSLLLASGACAQPQHAQATMVASWLTELLLDSINRELLESGGKPSPGYRAAEQQLHDFLCENVDVLDVGTTTGLLGAYGRLEELLTYAQARGDHEAVLEALLQRPGGALRALAVLRKPSCPRELVYRFAPALMADAPEETVDALVAANPPLEPRRLIPALLRFASPTSPIEGRQAVLRYLTYAVDGPPRCQDSAVHDLVVALCALADDEAHLLTYLARARSASGAPLYDPKYALRRAQEQNKDKATVRLLCELGMHTDAVRVACAHDNLNLAKAVASDAPDEDLVLGGPEGGMGGKSVAAVSPSSTRRRLWLAIARHVVQQQGSDADGPDQAARQTGAIKQAVDLLKEAEGLLKIEDVLPFFPNFVTIDNFKDAICDSLEQYNKQIEHLKTEMEEATGIADAVRADLVTLKGRVAAIQAEQACAQCGVGLLMKPPASALAGLPSGGALPPLYVFPSGLAYHGACCAAEAQALMVPPLKTRLRKVMTRLARTQPATGQQQPSSLPPSSQPLSRQSTSSHVSEDVKPTGGDGEMQALVAELHQLVASEDPRNGEMQVQLLDMEYVDPKEDSAEAASWRNV